MAGRATAKFKVSLWRPKGDALLHSTRFVARNPVHLDGDEGEDFPLVAPPRSRPWLPPCRSRR